MTAGGERGAPILAVHAAVTAEACIDGRGAAAAGGAAGSISCQLGRSPTSFTAEGHGGATVTDNEGRGTGGGGEGLGGGSQVGVTWPTETSLLAHVALNVQRAIRIESR